MLDVTARVVVATFTLLSWSITSLPKAKREPAFRPIANLANFSSSAHHVFPYDDPAFCVSAPCALPIDFQSRKLSWLKLAGPGSQENPVGPDNRDEEWSEL